MIELIMPKYMEFKRQDKEVQVHDIRTLLGVYELVCFYSFRFFF